jgi:hypothetical protein
MLRKSTWIGTAILLISLGLAVNPVRAQNSRGTILGHVQDPSGGAIPGATVAYRNVATGVSASFTTTSGDYVFVNLIPGSYEITCEAKGFKRGVSSQLVLQVDQTLRQDFALEVGAITQEITVSGAAQMVQTDNASLGGVITDRLMQTLPLNGRDFTSLVALDAGVSQPSGGIQVSVFDQHGLNDTWREASVNGARPGSVSYLIDGITNNDMFFTKAGVVPSEYSLQEFKVQTGLYSAEYGSGAAQINVAIKSGSNGLHGNAYDFLRNAAFAPDNQLNIQQNALHGTNLPLSDPLKQQNQFGGTFGGPIKRNRAFFFGSYEGGRRKTGGTAGSLMVPTDAERQGDFSDWPNPIYDPSTTAVTSTNPLTISRTQFPGNKITSGLNPIAQKLLDYYPHATANCTMPCQNFFGVNPGSLVDTNTVTGRVDYRISDRDQFSSSAVIWRDNAPQPSIIPVNSSTDLTHSQLYGLDWQHSFGPATVNDARVGYNRVFFHEGATSAFGPDLAKALGLQNTPTTAAFFNVPIVSPTQGYAGFGNGNNGYTQTDNIFEFVENLKLIRGKHTFTAGADIRRIQMADRDGFTAEGVLYFDGAYTGLSPSVSASGAPGPMAGNPIADLLLGNPIGSGAPAPIASDIFDLRGTSESLYFQDDYRVTPRLTVNLGFRWELPPNLYSITNSGVTLNPKTPGGGLIWVDKNFVTQNSVGLTAAQAATFMQCCNTNQLVPRDLHDFAPRFGFAWRPLSTDRLVVRGGYGMFYDIYMRFYDGAAYDDKSLWTNTPPPYPTATGFESVSPVALNTLWLHPIVGNPFPSYLAQPYFFGVQTEWPDNHTPYNQQWGLDTQYAFNQNLMLDIGYIGSHAIHEPIQNFFNQAYPPSVGNDPCNSLQDASQATGANAACLTDPNFQPIDQRTPYHNISSTTYANANILSSYYNALQVRLNERFAHGLQFMANYTYSKAMDMSSEIAAFNSVTNLVMNPHNLRGEYGPADFDQTHRLVLSYSYAVPVGKGRHWSLGPADWVVGGWNTSGILTFASGLPETVYCCHRVPTQLGITFGEAIRANVSGNPTAGITQTALEWVNPSAFSIPEAGTFGDSERNLVRIAGQRQGDIAFLKEFPITERHKLEFRLEIFNALSSTHTGQHLFDNNLSDSPANCTPGPTGNCSFGSTVSLNGAGALNYWNPRILQMALVYSF